MNEAKRSIILSNFDKLAENTICNTPLLLKLKARGTLSEEEVDELMGQASNSAHQVYRLYKIILTRTDGYDSLEAALIYTKQSAALCYLRKKASTGSLKGHKSEYKPDEITVGTFLKKGSSDTSVYRGTFGTRDCAVKKVHAGINTLQIEQELGVLNDCDTHKNIVRYFGCHRDQSYVFIALELCDMNLAEWVKKKSIKISPMNVLKEITEGLEFLHRKEIIHRDLKPENILLNHKFESVKISDFGLSKRLANGRSSVSSYGFGTNGWVAPEILGQRVSGTEKYKFTCASDLFSLGCVFFFVLSNGAHPFGDVVRREGNIIDGKLKMDPAAVQHGCIEYLRFIKQLISNNPNSRPSCTALLASPLFWNEDRQLCFLQGIKRVNNQKYTYLLSHKSTAECASHPTDETPFSSLGFTTSGCVIIHAYILYRSNKSELSKYYSPEFEMEGENLELNLVQDENKLVAQKLRPTRSLKNNHELIKSKLTATTNPTMEAPKVIRRKIVSSESLDDATNINSIPHPGQGHFKRRKISVSQPKIIPPVRKPSTTKPKPESTLLDWGRCGLFSPSVSDAFNLFFS